MTLTLGQKALIEADLVITRGERFEADFYYIDVDGCEEHPHEWNTDYTEEGGVNFDYAKMYWQDADGVDHEIKNTILASATEPTGVITLNDGGNIHLVLHGDRRIEPTSLEVEHNGTAFFEVGTYPYEIIISNAAGESYDAVTHEQILRLAAGKLRVYEAVNDPWNDHE